MTPEPKASKAAMEWRCFFCNELFTDESLAADHFGEQGGSGTACKITAHEGHILNALRRAEDALNRYRVEDSDLMRSIQSLEAAQAEKVRRAEEDGYARGVRDMKRQGYCVEPQKHEIKPDSAKPEREAAQKMAEWMRSKIKSAPTDADFAIGGRYDYDESCRNSGDIAALAVAKEEYEEAKKIRVLLAAYESAKGE